MRAVTDLDAQERRVLGALMEKQQTTPEYYPLTVKALVAASNQRSNRDPVMELTEMEVLNVLRVLQHDGWVERITGARVPRWAHRAEGRLGANHARLALITLLLLRGAQTPGELRSRSERLHPFESVEEVLEALREMAEREDPLVQMLPRQPGQKESRWMLVGETVEVEPVSAPVSPAEGFPDAEDLQSQIDELRERIELLEEKLGIPED